jgi:hypothetical protein
MTKKTPTSTKETPTSLRAKRSLSSVAFVARVLLHSFVLFVVVLFPCAAPSFGLFNLTESEAPVEEDESSEEEVTKVQARIRVARIRVARDQPGLPFLVPMRGRLNLATASMAGVPHSGHRLPNSLLAPLRC